MNDSKREKELSSADMELPDSILVDLSGAIPLPEDNYEESLPIVNPERPNRLIKKDDPQNIKPFIGAQYEVLQFDLWKEGQIQAYQDKLTEVGTNADAYITFQDRVANKDNGSWSVLLEIAHRVRVKR